MSRSCARRKKRSIASSEPRWMCWPSARFSRVNQKSRRKNQEREPIAPGMPETPVAEAASSALKLRRVAAWRGIRVLAWHGDILYGCRGYQIVRLRVGPEIDNRAEWETVARFRPVWWRNLTSRTALSYRLVRDGFHALAILGGSPDDQTMVGVVPGALVTRTPGTEGFQVTHQVQRGTRPLHVTAVPSGKIYWGEYFDNRDRAEVHIYVSADRGRTWQIAYTFSA